MSLHSQRDRASSFGADPERYDRARPDYPAALVDHLLGLTEREPATVLDVGCGTGIAGRQFDAAGAEVLGVEADARMAEVARRRGLDVEVAPFEEWDSAGRRFDLVIAAQAWHWLDPEVAPARAADVLRPGGVLAPFWNLGTHDEALRERLDRVYAELGPARGQPNPSIGGRSRGGGADHRTAIERCGRFGAVDEVDVRWERVYDRDEWLDQLPSHSDHRLMPAAGLDRLLAAIGEVIDDAGGAITMRYRCAALIARRR